MFRKEGKEERRDGTITKYVEESLRILWCKRSAPKRSKDDHGRVDYKMGGSNIDGVQGM